MLIKKFQGNEIQVYPQIKNSLNNRVQLIGILILFSTHFIKMYHNTDLKFKIF